LPLLKKLLLLLQQITNHMLIVTISKIDRWGREKNIDKLIEALEHSDEEIRKAAALCLGKVADRSVLDVLESAYERDANVFVKQDIKKAINLIKSKKFIPVGTPIFANTAGVKELKPAFSWRFRQGS